MPDFSLIQRQEHDSVRVLLFVTTRRRDLLPMKRLAAALTECGGYSVLLSGMSDFHFAVLDFKPNIVLIGKPDNAQGNWLRCISGCTIISLNTEQGGLDDTSVLFNYLEGQRPDVNTDYEQAPALELVDHHLIIDSFTKETLSPFINPDKMHVVGNPRLLQETFALSAKPVSSNMTIGFACGVNMFDKAYVIDIFECFQDRSYPPWLNVQAALADYVLEHLWINHLVSLYKEQHRVVVRYRPGDGSYLLDESGVKIDQSDSLEYLFSVADLIIVGQSTVGVEALMAGVPAISMAGLARPSEDYAGATPYWVPQLVWPANSLDELANLVDRRLRDELSLCPNPERYASEVRNTYYHGEHSDKSIARIVAVIDGCERGDGAWLDRKKLLSICNLSKLQRLLLHFPQSLSTRIPYRLTLWYTRARRRFHTDPYLQHHVYIPE